MKNYIFIFAVLLMFGCANRQSQHTDNIHQIAATNKTSNITHELLTWPDSATQIKYGALIDAIYAKCDSYVKVDSCRILRIRFIYPRMENTDFTVEMSIQLAKVMTMQHI